MKTLHGHSPAHPFSTRLITFLDCGSFEPLFLIIISQYAGTSEDYAQIIIAIFGGFLQQIVGPRSMLILATLPNILSWVIVGLASHNVVALIMSRILAGVSIGLMASNVYIADVASTKNIVFFNYMRQIFVTLGAILMYATMQTIYKVKQPKNSKTRKTEYACNLQGKQKSFVAHYKGLRLPAQLLIKLRNENKHLLDF